MSNSQNSDGNQDRLKLNAPRLIAGSLAAVTAAALSSRLGVAGTLVGAAVISLVSGAAATVYEHSVERGRAAVRNRLSGLEITGKDKTETTRSPRVATRGRLGALLHSPGRRWALAGVGALATFVVAIGLVTAIEAVHGKSLSGNGQTTLGQAFSESHHSTPQPDKQPTKTPSSSTSPSGSPSSNPSSSPSSSTSGNPSNTPTSNSPATAPSTKPTTSAPTTTTPPTSTPPPATTTPKATTPPASAPSP